jgi:hypothetical protein
LFEKLHDTKHVVIQCSEQSFFKAGALYYHLLREEKKVTLFAVSPIKSVYAVFEWFSKIREQKPQSVDSFFIDADTLFSSDIFRLAIREQKTLKPKLATALYGAYIVEYNNFTTKECNGMVFAAVSQLLEAGAEHEKLVEAIVFTQPLWKFRARAFLLQSLLLCENGTVGVVSFNKKMLESVGVEDEHMLYELLDEFLRLVHVKEVRLVDSDLDNTVVKTVKG